MSKVDLSKEKRREKFKEPKKGLPFKSVLLSFCCLAMLSVLGFLIIELVKGVGEDLKVEAHQVAKQPQPKEEVVEKVEPPEPSDKPVRKTIKTGELIISVKSDKFLKDNAPFVVDSLYIHFGGFEQESDTENVHFTMKTFGTRYYSDQYTYQEEYSYINVSEGDIITLPLTPIQLKVVAFNIEENSLTLETVQ